MLTKERVQELLEYNPDTGKFTWKSTRNPKAKAGSVCKPGPHGYVTIMIDGANYRACRLVFLLEEGVFPEHQVDHIDMDRANDKRSNLRKVTNAQNNQNRPSRNYHKQPAGVGHTVYLNVNNKRMYFGTYRDEELAQLVAEEVRNKYHGEYARGL